MLRKYLFALSLLFAAIPAWADLPLTIEDLLTDKGKIKLELGISYANSNRHGISTGEPLIIQTGATSFVLVPTLIGESLDNRDTLVARGGLRYGLTAKTELYSRFSGLSSWQRSSGVSRTSSNHSSSFADAKAGINYQFKYETSTPALLGFAELTLAEKQRYSYASFKSAMAGFTTWKAIDPLVFSFTDAYSLNLPRDDGGQRYRPGDLILLHPAVAFAVNDRVSLSGGLQWTWRQADQRNGLHSGINRSNTDLLPGVGYGISRGNIINTTFKLNAAGDGGAQLWLNWLYTFGSLL